MAERRTSAQLNADDEALIRQLKARIASRNARERSRAEKIRNRRLIILGALIETCMAEDADYRAATLRQLAKRAIREVDRPLIADLLSGAPAPPPGPMPEPAPSSTADFSVSAAGVVAAAAPNASGTRL